MFELRKRRKGRSFNLQSFVYLSVFPNTGLLGREPLHGQAYTSPHQNASFKIETLKGLKRKVP